jgi:hypothetical protein
MMTWTSLPVALSKRDLINETGNSNDVVVFNVLPPFSIQVPTAIRSQANV